MIKVAINTQPLVSAHRVRGIGVYAKGLMTALQSFKEIEIEEFTKIESVESTDLVHYLAFDLFTHSLPIKKKAKTIVTIHDCTPLLFPKYYPIGIKGYLNLNLQKISLKNTSAIVTDSLSAKKDIMENLGVEGKKITVVYPAADKSYRKIDNLDKLEEFKKKHSLPDKFVLFGGNINWNKNLNAAIEACLGADIDVVVRGSSFESKANLDHPEMESFKIFLSKFADHPKVHNLGFIEDSDSVKLYNLASVTLLPSLAEGFGLPIIESQLCGTPVITSNISSMPEIAGKGAVLVDPYNTSEISHAIKELLSNEALQKTLIKEGFDNASRFTWQKAAEQTVELYARVLEGEVFK